MQFYINTPAQQTRGLVNITCPGKHKAERDLGSFMDKTFTGDLFHKFTLYSTK